MTNIDSMINILNQRIQQKSNVVTNLNQQSFTCKKLWIAGMAGVFIYFIQPILIRKGVVSDPIPSDTTIYFSVTFLSRAILAVIVITILFWLFDGVTWYFQRQLRREINKLEIILWQIAHSDHFESLGYSEWEYLTDKHEIDPMLIALDKPNALTSLLNKSMMIYITTCFFLSCVHICLFAIINKDLISFIITSILIFCVGAFLRTGYKVKMYGKYIYMFFREEKPKGNSPEKEQSEYKRTILYTIALSGILFLIGLYNILKKFEVSFNCNLSQLWSQIISNDELYENIIIFCIISGFCAIMLALSLFRIDHMSKFNQEKKEHMKTLCNRKHVTVLYSLKDSTLRISDLRILKRKLLNSGKYNVYIDYIDNYKNKLTDDWRANIEQKIKASDFIIKIQSDIETTSTIFEDGLLKQYKSPEDIKIYTVDDIRTINIDILPYNES